MLKTTISFDINTPRVVALLGGTGMYFYLTRSNEVERFTKKILIGFSIGAALAGYGAGTIMCDFLQQPLVIRAMDKIVPYLEKIWYSKIAQ